jgi:hypothetical protein
VLAVFCWVVRRHESLAVVVVRELEKVRDGAALGKAEHAAGPVEIHLHYWIVVVVAVAAAAVAVLVVGVLVVVVHAMNRTKYRRADLAETRKRLCCWYYSRVTEVGRPKKSLLRYQTTWYLELA